MAMALLPGHGKSGGPTGEIGTMADYGQAIADVMTELAGSANFPVPVTAFGHSLGGRLHRAGRGSTGLDQGARPLALQP